MALMGWVKLWISHQRGLTSERGRGPWYGMVYVWALLRETETVTKCVGQARGVIMVVGEKRTKRVWAPQTKRFRNWSFSQKIIMNEIIIYYEFMWLKINRSLSSSFCSLLLGQLVYLIGEMLTDALRAFV